MSEGPYGAWDLCKSCSIVSRYRKCLLTGQKACSSGTCRRKVECRCLAGWLCRCVCWPCANSSPYSTQQPHKVHESNSCRGPGRKRVWCWVCNKLTSAARGTAAVKAGPICSCMLPELLASSCRTQACRRKIDPSDSCAGLANCLPERARWVSSSSMAITVVEQSAHLKALLQNLKVSMAS